VKRRNSSIKLSTRLSRSSAGAGDNNTITSGGFSRALSPEKIIERSDSASVHSRLSHFTSKTTKTARSRRGVNKEHQLLYENQSKTIIETLQQQLNISLEKIKTHEMEINELKTSIAAREQELARANTHSLSYANNPSSTSTSNTLGGLKSSSSDMANKRIIDQLNNHVDFLNDQLALREVQIQQLHNDISETDRMRVEMENK
jgi:benzoyl-CoA reductase/2-hydroxyglutaryl-CoA dehydratase subunit BcrC/BadD/HgdB